MDGTDSNVKKYLESGTRFYYVIRHVVSKGREHIVRALIGGRKDVRFREH